MGFQQGLSGLDTATKFLDVIGNNVANSNTVGFKGSRAQFSDIYANSLASTSTQTGIGGRTETVAQQFSQGNMTSTNSPLDLAIQGNGFYRMVSNAGDVSYTRNGQFQLDREGFIVNGDQKLAGYGVNNNGQLVTGATPNPIKIQTANFGARATGASGLADAGVTLAVNLDARAPVTSRGTTTFSVAGLQLDNAAAAGTLAGPFTSRIADSQGGYHTMTVSLLNLAPGSWQVQTALDGATTNTPGPTIQFDSKTGVMTTAQPVKLSLTPINPAAPTFTMNLDLSGTTEVAAGGTPTTPVTSSAGSAAARPSMAILGSNLDPTSATAVTYTANLIPSDGSATLIPVVVSLTPGAAGSNQWAVDITPAATPVVPLPPIKFDPTTGKVVSGGSLSYTFPDPVNTAPGAPGITMNFDFSNITQIRGAAVAGTTTLRSVTPVTATDPTTFTSSTSATVFDAQGVAHTETYFFTKVAPNVWEVQTSFDGGEPQVQANFMTFKGDGTMNTAGSVFATNNNIVAPSGATTPLSFTTRMSASTQYGSTFGVSSLAQDGFGDGTLTGLSIGKDGVIQGRYSNGQNRTVGQIVLYNFANPQGLQSLGGNRWAETFGSNTARLGIPGTSDFGSLQSGTVEDSNIDLTKELVDMITAQRTYQANAQTIKTQDQILQTLVNLK